MRQHPPSWRLLATTIVFVAAAPLAAETPVFKIYLEDDGVYRVGFEDLQAAGLDRPLASAGLGLTCAGQDVPVWLEDGGDGVFGPGDHLEFVGEHLAGEHSYLDELARFNVYFLAFDRPRPARRTAAAMSAGRDAGPADFRGYRTRRHLEKDLVILRLPPTRDGGGEELWYWHKLSHVEKEPFVQVLDLHDLERSPEGTVDLVLRFRGWSTPGDKAVAEAGDHRVEAALNGQPLSSAEWNGTAPYTLEVADMPASAWNVGENRLELWVPPRKVAKDGRALIDVVMLGSIDVDYPRNATFTGDQARFELAGPESSKAARVVADAARELVLYGDHGSRLSTRSAAAAGAAGERATVFEPRAGERRFWAAFADALLAPHAVVRDRPSDWAATDHQADYVMIAHRRLIDAVEPLAELHRARGLAVAVVDVEDVYDEFGYGIAHPQPLRDFLTHAYHRWRPPAPRFVLLVGDASWDAKNATVNLDNYPALGFHPHDAYKFPQVPSTPYARDPDLNYRGLVPTWNHAGYQGHAASDNHFVAVDGDDGLPDMAIGRLPVVEPEEVAAIVAKTIRYASHPEVGPWRRNVLFITNEYDRFQQQSDVLARHLSIAGYTPNRIYPASREASNEHHSQRLIETFNEGQLFVHFLGHGGRYIWRTGPPDLQKNHDLFTLEHLDRLEATGRLPVVLSMTCYSAPFDHPNADSIGEKLLRIADRGAVAVLAASWRNSPSPSWGEATLEELTVPGTTIGEAVMRAKRRVQARPFVETYNLLGDPAVPVALPAGRIALEAVTGDGGGWDVRGQVALDGFEGELLVDLVDSGGRVLETIAARVESGAFSIAFSPQPTGTWVRAYAWNGARAVDAAGTLDLAHAAAAVSAVATDGGSTAGTR